MQSPFPDFILSLSLREQSLTWVPYFIDISIKIPDEKPMLNTEQSMVKYGKGVNGE